MVPGVQEEGEEARGLVQPRVSGCTEKATCFHTANKAVTFATLPGLASECHPAGQGLRVFVGCLGWSTTWATESPSLRS